MGARRSINSISVGFRLVRALEQARRPMSLTELAKIAKMPTSQAHLYLVSFVNEGLVKQNAETSRYTLGAYALHLGMVALAGIDVIDVAYDALKELVVATGESGHISVWGVAGPVMVRKVDGVRQMQMSLRLGNVAPLLSTATGRIFLAYMPDAVTQPIVEMELKRSHAAPVKRADVMALKASIRSLQIAHSDSLLNSGFAGFSVPVFDHAGDLACSITLMGPRTVFDATLDGPVAAALLEQSRKVSARIGHLEDMPEAASR